MLKQVAEGNGSESEVLEFEGICGRGGGSYDRTAVAL